MGTTSREKAISRAAHDSTAGVWHDRPTASLARPVVGSEYTLGEEIANSITSGIASALSVAALVVMVVHAALRGDGWHVTGCAIFGTSLIVSNLSSTLYHAIAPPRAKRVFRVFDHLSILLPDRRDLHALRVGQPARGLGLDAVRRRLGAGRAGPRHQADPATSSARAVHRVLSHHGLDGAHRDQARAGAPAPRRRLVATGL